MHILNEMNKAIAKPRENPKAHVPRISTMTIAKAMIGAVIGSGGKVIQEIQRKRELLLNQQLVVGHQIQLVIG